jgi:hypothetical protein
MGPLMHRALHRRILVVLGAVIAVMIAMLLIGSREPGLHRLVAVVGSIALAGGFMLYAAVSSILVGFTVTRRGLVLAHVASPFVIAALAALRHALR